MGQIISDQIRSPQFISRYFREDTFDLYNLYDMYDLPRVTGWEPYITCMIYRMFPGLDLYPTDPAQHFLTAGEELDDLQIYHDLSDLSDLSDAGKGCIKAFRTAFPSWGIIGDKLLGPRLRYVFLDSAVLEGLTPPPCIKIVSASDYGYA